MNKKNHHCEHCGECCKLLLPLTEKDIARIKRAGQSNFTMMHPLRRDEGNIYLRLENGKCIFLRYDVNKQSRCMIYKSRPQVCRDYPFFKGIDKLDNCRPKRFL
jgi:Fe-S-cluster containining protein